MFVPHIKFTNYYFSLLLILMVIFGFLVLFTFLGCCGSACQNRCMLGSHVIILFVFLGANVGGIIYLFAFYGVPYGSPEGKTDEDTCIYTYPYIHNLANYRENSSCIPKQLIDKTYFTFRFNKWGARHV